MTSVCCSTECGASQSHRHYTAAMGNSLALDNSYASLFSRLREERRKDRGECTVCVWVFFHWYYTSIANDLANEIHVDFFPVGPIRWFSIWYQQIVWYHWSETLAASVWLYCIDSFCSFWLLLLVLTLPARSDSSWSFWLFMLVLTLPARFDSYCSFWLFLLILTLPDRSDSYSLSRLLLLVLILPAHSDSSCSFWLSVGYKGDLIASLWKSSKWRLMIWTSLLHM